jgi:cytochrome c-type biogenesis protein CcmE
VDTGQFSHKNICTSHPSPYTKKEQNHSAKHQHQNTDV